MVAGLERYYQIARCFRDEDFRADRQPEFTQLDIEMSFVDPGRRASQLAEDLVARLWAELAGYEMPAADPADDLADAMARYGSDKPDLRFGVELTDLTDYFAGTEFRVFQAAVRRRGGDAGRRGADPARARRLAGVGQVARRPRAGLRGCSTRRPARLAGRWPRTCPRPSGAGLAEAVGAKPGDAVFFAAGDRRTPRSCSARPGWRSAAAAG